MTLIIKYFDLNCFEWFSVSLDNKTTIVINWSTKIKWKKKLFGNNKDKQNLKFYGVYSSHKVSSVFKLSHFEWLDLMFD